MSTKSAFTLFLFFVPFVCLAQEKWDLKKSDNGIEVYSRKLDNERYKELRVICQFNASIAQLVATLQNVEDHTKWSYGTKKAYLLKRESANKLTYYSEISLPWPLSNRDAVTEMNFKADSDSVLYITAVSRPTMIPPKKNLVRVPFSLAEWKVQSLPGNKIAIEYIFSANPGGALPAWMVNLATSTGPHTSFMKLREIVQNQKM